MHDTCYVVLFNGLEFIFLLIIANLYAEADFFFILGGTPYPRIKGRDVYSLLKEGYRIEKPSHVDNEL